MSLNHSETYTIFLFPNSHAAIKAELTVKKVYSAEVSRLIPLPPEVSAGCGMVLRVVPTEAASVKKLLEEASVPVEGTYTLKVTDGKREVTLAEAWSKAPQADGVKRIATQAAMPSIKLGLPLVNF